MSTPDIPTAKAVAKALLEAKESQESVVNLSREMAESYKKIFALMGGITKQADLQKTFSNENDIVLDNTMGSGTTGIGAINNNRKFIGIELEAKYYKLAKYRILNVKD